MRRFSLFLAATALALTSCSSPTPSPTAEVEDHRGHITVTNAYVVVAKAGESTEAFMTVRNNHDDPVTLTGSTAKFAETSTTADCSQSTPTPHKKGVGINGGEVAELKPNGDCLLFQGLRENLIVGDEVIFTLTFSDGHSVEVTAPVKAR
jgi:copper(I)-binding protein